MKQYDVLFVSKDGTQEAVANVHAEDEQEAIYRAKRLIRNSKLLVINVINRGSVTK